MKKKGLLYLKMFLIILLSSSTTMCSKKSGDQGSSSESNDKQKFENAEERATKAKEEADATAKAAADAAADALNAANTAVKAAQDSADAASISAANAYLTAAKIAAESAKKSDATQAVNDANVAQTKAKEALAAAKAAAERVKGGDTKAADDAVKAANEAATAAQRAADAAKRAKDALDAANAAEEEAKREQKRMQPNGNKEVDVPSPGNPNLTHQEMILNYTKETNTNGVTVDFKLPNATPEILQNICKKVTITTEAGYGLVKLKSEFVFVQDDPQQQTQFNCIANQETNTVTLSTPPFENKKFRPWVEKFHILFDQNPDYQFDVSVNVDASVTNNKQALTRGLINEMVLDETFFGCGLNGTVLQRIFDCSVKVKNPAVTINHTNAQNYTNKNEEYYSIFNSTHSNPDDFWFLVSCPAGKKVDMENKSFVPQQSCAWLSPVITPDNPALELEGNPYFSKTQNGEFVTHHFSFTLDKFKNAYQNRILWGGKLNHNGFGYTFRQANGYELDAAPLYYVGENPGAGSTNQTPSKRYKSVCEIGKGEGEFLAGFDSGDKGLAGNLWHDFLKWFLKQSELTWVKQISETDLSVREMISKTSGASSVSWEMPSYPELITLTGGTPVLGKGIQDLLDILLEGKSIDDLVPLQYRTLLKKLKELLDDKGINIKIPTIQDTVEGVIKNVAHGEQYCGGGWEKGLAYFCNMKPLRPNNQPPTGEHALTFLWKQPHLGFSALNVPGFVSTGAFFQKIDVNIPTKFPAFPAWPSDNADAQAWWKFTINTTKTIKDYYKMAKDFGEDLAPLLSHQPNNEFLWSSSVGLKGNPTADWVSDKTNGFMYVPFGVIDVNKGSSFNNKYPWWGGYVNDTSVALDFAPSGVRCVSTSWY